MKYLFLFQIQIQYIILKYLIILNKKIPFIRLLFYMLLTVFLLIDFANFISDYYAMLKNEI